MKRKIIIQSESEMQLCPRSGNQELIEPLHDCLAMLPSEQKLILHLRFWEDLEISQIAEVTHLSWDRVDSILRKTIADLRRMLERRRDAQSAAA